MIVQISPSLLLMLCSFIFYLCQPTKVKNCVLFFFLFLLLQAKHLLIYLQIISFLFLWTTFYCLMPIFSLQLLDFYWFSWYSNRVHLSSYLFFACLKNVFPNFLFVLLNFLFFSQAEIYNFYTFKFITFPLWLMPCLESLSPL